MTAFTAGGRTDEGRVAVTPSDREDRPLAAADFDCHPQRRPPLVRGQGRAGIPHAALAVGSPIAAQSAREVQPREALAGSTDGRGRVVEVVIPQPTAADPP